MKAVVINNYGSSDVLEYREDIPEPKPARNQVLIRVRAASINPLDWKIRRGDLRFLINSKFPLVLGNDVSGTIIRAGDAVKGYAEGDDVFCMLDANAKPSLNGFAKSGGYAEFAVTRDDTLSKKPEELSHVEAAAVPLAALTAYQSFAQIAGVKPGQTVAINGASGGVGTFAVQIAKAFGARVTAVCSDRNMDLVRNLGADDVVDYREGDFIEAGTSFDVIYDVAANRSFAECRRALTDTGLYISTIPSLYSLSFRFVYPLMRALGNQKRFGHAWVKPSGEDLEAIKELIEKGLVRPVVGAVYPLQEARLAHDAGEGGKVCGKTVLNLL